MNETQYNAAVKKRKTLTVQLETLNDNILEYENKNLVPDYYIIEDVREFITEGNEDAPFAFEGVLYVVGDYEELIREYGWESVTDGFNNATIEELDDSYGVIRKFNKSVEKDL